MGGGGGGEFGAMVSINRDDKELQNETGSTGLPPSVNMPKRFENQPKEESKASFNPLGGG